LYTLYIVLKTYHLYNECEVRDKYWFYGSITIIRTLLNSKEGEKMNKEKNSHGYT